MPRIAVCLNYADINTPRFSGENDYLDYCAKCYAAADEAQIAAKYGVAVEAVDKIDQEHFDYADEWENYTCECCGKRLTAEDN